MERQVSGARILLAEDDQAVRDFVRRALEMDGHEVTAVHDGGEALEYLTSPIRNYDLLLADIRMPVIDGIALALRLARDKPDLPILLMTGYAQQRERASNLKAVIHEVIQKPFTLEQIREHVQAALGQSRDQAGSQRARA